MLPAQVGAESDVGRRSFVREAAEMVEAEVEFSGRVVQLAGNRRAITIVLQDRGKEDLSIVGRHSVECNAVDVSVAAGEHTCARRGAHRRDGVGVGKSDALPRQPIEIRSRHDRVLLGAHGVPSHFIDHDEENVGPLPALIRGARGRAEQEFASGHRSVL